MGTQALKLIFIFDGRHVPRGGRYIKIIIQWVLGALRDSKTRACRAARGFSETCFCWPREGAGRQEEIAVLLFLTPLLSDFLKGVLVRLSSANKMPSLTPPQFQSLRQPSKGKT